MDQSLLKMSQRLLGMSQDMLIQGDSLVNLSPFMIRVVYALLLQGNIFPHRVADHV
jgi:hypothetical protein